MPTIFTERADKINAIYDWYDATANTGYKTFYCCIDTKTGPAYTYFLTPNKINANPTKDSFIFSGAVSKDWEKDFDITFNQPAYIKGEAILNSSWAVTGSDSTGYYAVYTLYHVSAAAVETQLATGTTQTYAGGGFPPYNQRECIKLTLTEHSIAIGEKLRLTIEIWGGKSSGGNCEGYIALDPASSNAFATIYDYDTRIDIPFRLDL